VGVGTERDDAIADAENALRSMSSWPVYAPTPLRTLDTLAERLSIRSILYKDEAHRFGLQSFKIMGAGYAMSKELCRALELSGEPTFERVRKAIDTHGAPFTVACATDGNHGRAVAWAASRLSLPCVVFLHAGVSQAREQAIQKLGAQIRRVAGNYDDSVRVAADEANRHGWRIISDTAYDGYERIPQDIMRGYMGIAAEMAPLIPPALMPTHVIVQAGVGGLAAAMFSYFTALEHTLPIVNICIEPLEASCLLRSARAGKRVAMQGSLDTIMAGLACGEPSTIAWLRLQSLDVHYLALEDRAAEEAMRDLADKKMHRPPIIAGESGAVGLAGLLSIAARADLRAAIGLGSDSTVLLIGTEGATDPSSYDRIIQQREH
jgi:diaminopropionate ammonia-lyase